MAKNKPESKPAAAPSVTPGPAYPAGGVEASAPASAAPVAKAPTLAEVVAAGYDLRAAHGVVAEEEALAGGMSVADAAEIGRIAVSDFDARQPAKEPDAPKPPTEPVAPVRPAHTAIVVTSTASQFFRCGRKYTRTATTLQLSELKPGELARLEQEAAAKHLIVKRV